MHFVKHHIKNHKAFLQQWEKAQRHLPSNCYFIQKLSSKNGELAISVWNFHNLKALEVFIREYFNDCCEWKCYELDEYYIEGKHLKKAI